MTEGTSRETALVDAEQDGVWVEDGWLYVLGRIPVMPLTSARRIQFARLLARDLPPTARAELCRDLLGVTQNEVDGVAAHAIMLKDDPMASLLAKLEGTQ